jgi:hypothetical protein
MERGEEEGQEARNNGDADRRRSGRSWTIRSSGPVRYERLTDVGPNHNRRILFRFEVQDRVDDAVYKVLSRHKKIQGTDRPTGLKFTHDRLHGRVWVLPDTPLGNAVADSIDGQLSLICEKRVQDASPRR